MRSSPDMYVSMRESRGGHKRTLKEGSNANNDLNCVAKGRIEQAGQGLPQLRGHLVRRIPQKLHKRASIAAKGGGDKRAPRTFASGTMAMKLNTKRSAASQFKWCEMKLRGMKMRSTLSQEPKRKCL